jgi:hypothetical protein
MDLSSSPDKQAPSIGRQVGLRWRHVDGEVFVAAGRNGMECPPPWSYSQATQADARQDHHRSLAASAATAAHAFLDVARITPAGRALTARLPANRGDVA